MIYKKLQLVYNTSYKANKKESNFPMGNGIAKGI